MNKLIALFLLIVFVGMFPAIGQVISDEEVIELLNGDPIIKDFVVMSQIQEDIATINPQSGLSVQILQNGNRNSGIIEQIGSGLNTYLLQDGSFNESNLWSEGNNIHTQIKQNGDGNIINSYIENDGVDLRSATLLQKGNQNRIDLSLIGNGFDNNPVAQTVIINQFGSQHEVKAFMEPFSAPVEITQYPGIGGEGMKVNISTSTFNFPMKK